MSREKWDVTIINELYESLLRAEERMGGKFGPLPIRNFMEMMERRREEE